MKGKKALGKVRLTEDEVVQEFDFEEELGVDLSRDPSLRTAIGQKIIDRIIDRTLNSDGVVITKDGNVRKGGKIKPSKYSEEYAESDEFKAFGKQKNKVNMRLTGDMLGTLDIKDQSGSSIKIGWRDQVQNAKAFNHNTGDTVPKRQFFGVSSKELKEIANQFKNRIDQLKRRETPRVSTAEAIIQNLLREFDNNG